jgi:hypothetical protein
MSAAQALVYGEFCALLGERHDVESLTDEQVGKLLWQARSKYRVRLSENALIRIARKAQAETFRRRRRAGALA